MRDAEIVAGDQHFVSRTEPRVRTRLDSARDIDAANERKAANDLPGASGRERVLVVDSGICRLDHHLAGTQVVQRQRCDSSLHLAAVFEEAERAKGLRAHLFLAFACSSNSAIASCPAVLA